MFKKAGISMSNFMYTPTVAIIVIGEHTQEEIESKWYPYAEQGYSFVVFQYSSDINEEELQNDIMKYKELYQAVEILYG